MLGQTADDIVRSEIESVRARRIILDQLEGGPKTGTELRESIRKDMTATLIDKKGKKSAKVVVTDPKLYHNTSYLEKIGIIQSRRESRERIFELDLHAYHPVRRALNISRPVAYIASVRQPDDQRPFAIWLRRSKMYRPKRLLLFTEERVWKRQKLRSLDRFMSGDSHGQMDTVTRWFEIPLEITTEDEDTQHGNLQAVYQCIENEVLETIPTHNVVVDLSMGTPLTILALVRLVQEYALTAIHVQNYEDERTKVIQYLPRGENNGAW
jgi:hypothetical protein